jgi:hypothetical protein
MTSIASCPSLNWYNCGEFGQFGRRSLSLAQTEHFTPVGLLATIPLYFAARDAAGLSNGTVAVARVKEGAFAYQPGIPSA